MNATADDAATDTEELGRELTPAEVDRLRPMVEKLTEGVEYDAQGNPRLSPAQADEFVRLALAPPCMVPAEPKMGLAEIDGEVKLVPQAGERLTVPRGAGRYIWDGADDKGHAAVHGFKR